MLTNVLGDEPQGCSTRCAVFLGAKITAQLGKLFTNLFWLCRSDAQTKQHPLLGELQKLFKPEPPQPHLIAPPPYFCICLNRFHLFQKFLYMKNIIFVSIAAASLYGCGEGKMAASASDPKPSSSEIVIRTGSPDEAVKSWWAIRDEEYRLAIAICRQERETQKKHVSEKVEKVAAGHLLAMYKWLGCTPDIYEREIESVKVESETRGLVFATVKNVSPIPDGAVPDSYDKERRPNGEKFKYLVEKVDGQWRVSDVQIYNRFGSSTGDIWKSVYKDLAKPSYPAYVPENQ